MKGRIKKGLKRSVSATMALMLIGMNAVDMLPVSQEPVQASAGTIANLVTGNFTAIGLEYLERTVLRGLGAAASRADNEAVSQILTKTKRLLGNPTSNAISDLTQLCKQMDQKLTMIQNSIKANDLYLDARLTELQEDINKTTYDTKATELNELKGSYTTVLSYYQQLISAINNYSENPTSANLNAVRSAYSSLDDLYEKANGINDNIAVSFNFTNDCNTLAGLLSSYPATQPVDFSKDVSDSSAWGSKGSSSTYVTSFYDVIKTKDAFDHEYYQDITSQYNNAAFTAYQYLQAYEFYVTYAAQKIYSTPYDKLGISQIKNERQKQDYVDKLWAGYDKAAYIINRAMAQMLSEYDDKLAGAMRPYDIDSTMYIKAEDSIKPYEYYLGAHNQDVRPDFGSEETIQKAKTSEKMQIKQVRPWNKGTAYAFRTYSEDEGGQQALTLGDMVCTSHKVVVGLVVAKNTCHGMSCDYHNLSRMDYSKNNPGKYTKDIYAKVNTKSPAGWDMISQTSDLSDLFSPVAFDATGGDLMSYLNVHTATDDPRAIGGGTYMLTDQWDWGDYDCDFGYIKIGEKINKNDMGSLYTTLDCEDDILDKGSSVTGLNVMAAYMGEPTVAFVIPDSGDGADVKAVSRQKNTSLGKSTVLNCGDAADIRIKPAKGKYIKSLKLIDTHAKNEGASEEDYLLKEYISQEDDPFIPLNGCQTDSEGYYNFTVNVPFRDAELVMELADDENPSEYTVTLAESEDVDTSVDSYDKDGGILLLDGVTGNTSGIYASGEEVVVDVLPYEGQVCTGLEFFDSDGNQLGEEVVSAEEQELMMLNIPCEKEFAFSMPSQNVVVKAVYSRGYLVEMNKDKNDKHIDLHIGSKATINSDWSKQNMYFSPGESVSIFADVNDTMHYVSSVDAVAVPSMEEVEVINGTGNDRGVTKPCYIITMPKSDVSVYATAAEFESGKHGVTIDVKDIPGHSVSFTEDEYKELSYIQKAEGEKVSFEVDEKLYHEGYKPVVKDEDGNDVPFTSDQNISEFTMPDLDVTISLTKTDETHHIYNDNGFCKYCGKYQACVKNSTGAYQINNAGNFLWFAAMVNDEHSDLASFDVRERDADAVLTADIDLENRSFNNIGKSSTSTFDPQGYSGSFDGQGHTITNFYADAAKEHRAIFGTTEGAEIKNFTVKGKIGSKDKDAGKEIRTGVVGTASDTKISGVTSYVDYSDINGTVLYGGGICAVMTGSKSSIDRCVNFGKIDVTPSGKNALLGGICGYFYCTGTLSNCANLGKIKASDCNKAGVAADLTFDGGKVENCYTHEGSGLPVVDNKNSETKVDNCYDNNTSDDKYRSGEIGFKLNNGVTDGSQAWYQDIDNGKGPDNDPLPYTDKGTIYQAEGGYSNFDGTPVTDEFTISTYEELVDFAEKMDSEYNTYKNINARLANNIKAPDDSVWTKAIGSEEKPYNGTFNGDGNVIIGLNVNIPDNGGLFGCIGEKGVVKDLMVLDCDSVDRSKLAGGIAVINNGTLDHCTSGHNLDPRTVIKLPDGRELKVSEYNSFVNGEKSGGITAVNNGAIIGCRNGATVSGINCGGIAYENNGSIYGCSNNGASGSTSVTCKSAGGIVGVNKGGINSSYNSGKVSCYQKNYAYIAVNNCSDDVNYVFYSDVNSVPPVGAASEKDINDTNELVKNEDMLKSSFVDKLKSVTDDTVEWQVTKYGNTYFNQGYPTIKGRFLEKRELKLGSIMITGLMHKDLNVGYEEVSSLGDNGSGTRYYKASISDANGNYVPGELWCCGITVKVPVSSDSAAVTAIGLDGKKLEITPTIEDGHAVFELAEPLSFSITENAGGNNDPSSKNDSKPSDENPATGSGALAGTTALLLIGAVMIVRKRERND